MPVPISFSIVKVLLIMKKTKLKKIMDQNLKFCRKFVMFESLECGAHVTLDG